MILIIYLFNFGLDDCILYQLALFETIVSRKIHQAVKLFGKKITLLLGDTHTQIICEQIGKQIQTSDAPIRLPKCERILYIIINIIIQVHPVHKHA